MKKNLLILSLLAGVIALPACAELTVEDSSSREYLLKHNYSQSTVEIIERGRASANGEEYVKAPVRPCYQKGPIKWIRSVFIYLDPALDDGQFMNHDIKPTSHHDDL